MATRIVTGRRSAKAMGFIGGSANWPGGVKPGPVYQTCGPGEKGGRPPARAAGSRGRPAGPARPSRRREAGEVVDAELLLDRGDLRDRLLEPLAEVLDLLGRHDLVQGREQHRVLARLVRAVHADERLAGAGHFLARFGLAEPVRGGGAQDRFGEPSARGVLLPQDGDEV